MIKTLDNDLYTAKDIQDIIKKYPEFTFKWVDELPDIDSSDLRANCIYAKKNTEGNSISVFEDSLPDSDSEDPETVTLDMSLQDISDKTVLAVYASKAFNQVHQKIPEQPASLKVSGLLLSDVTSAFVDIAYGNGIYIGVCSDAIYTSTDAVTWTRRTVSDTITGGESIAFGNGKFILASRMNLYSSTDGITWEQLSVSSSYGDLTVRYLHDRFFVGGYRENGEYSLDGITWEKISGTSVTRNTLSIPIAYFNNFYIFRTDATYISTDGVNFTSIAITVSNSSDSHYLINDNKLMYMYNSILYVATYENETWSITQYEIVTGSNQQLQTLQYINNEYYAFGYNNSTNKAVVYKSTDLETWVDISDTIDAGKLLCSINVDNKITVLGASETSNNNLINIEYKGTAAQDRLIAEYTDAIKSTAVAVCDTSEKATYIPYDSTYYVGYEDGTMSDDITPDTRA